MAKATLNPELKGKYKIVDTDLPGVRTANRYYEFATLTQEEADELIANGSGYLEKVGKTEK